MISEDQIITEKNKKEIIIIIIIICTENISLKIQF